MRRKCRYFTVVSVCNRKGRKTRIRTIGPQTIGPRTIGPQTFGPRTIGPRKNWQRNTRVHPNKFRQSVVATESKMFPKWLPEYYAACYVNKNHTPKCTIDRTLRCYPSPFGIGGIEMIMYETLFCVEYYVTAHVYCMYNFCVKSTGWC